MDFVLINHNLNLIGPANILTWAMNCWQQLTNVPSPKKNVRPVRLNAYTVVHNSPVACKQNNFNEKLN